MSVRRVLTKSSARALLVLIASVCSHVNAEEAPQVSAFDIYEYLVQGNTVLTTLQIEQTLTPFLGPQKNIKDVELARKALEEAYRQSGYATVFVDIPEQEVNAGQVTLQVTEGKITKVKVSGSRYFLHGPILNELSSLAEGKVPYLPEVEKQLVSVNRNANRFITPVLKPGLLPGTVEVEFKVADQLPLGASFELNDRYSPNTSKTRANFGLHYDNLWQREHVFSMQYQSSPEVSDEISVYSSSYMMPLRAIDSFFVVYGVKSDSSIATVADAGDISVLGRGRIAGLRNIMQFEGSQEYFHSLTLGADYKDFEDTISLQNETSDNDDPLGISYVPFTLGYNISFNKKSFTTRFDVTGIFGLRGVGGSDDEFRDKRASARANYLYTRFSFDHEHSLPMGFGVDFRWVGQVSSGPLISNEQMTAGGADTVRGYLESERVGDEGMIGSLQMRSPHLLTFDAFQESYIMVFTDGAWMRVRDALPQEEPNFTLASAGAGVHIKAFKRLALSFEWAQALEHGVYTQSRDDRTHAKLMYSF